MSFAPEYLDPDHAPTREQLNQRRGLVLVEFGTAWCGYCQAAASGVKSLLARYPAVEHVKVEDGPGRALGRSFRVKLWPNFVFMRDGAVVHQLARPSRAELDEIFDGFVGSPAAGS
jgi:thioredoxin 1